MDEPFLLLSCLLLLLKQEEGEKNEKKEINERVRRIHIFVLYD